MLLLLLLPCSRISSMTSSGTPIVCMMRAAAPSSSNELVILYCIRLSHLRKSLVKARIIVPMHKGVVASLVHLVLKLLSQLSRILLLEHPCYQFFVLIQINFATIFATWWLLWRLLPIWLVLLLIRLWSHGWRKPPWLGGVGSTSSCNRLMPTAWYLWPYFGLASCNAGW